MYNATITFFPLCLNGLVIVDHTSQWHTERAFALLQPCYLCYTEDTQSFGKIHLFHCGLQRATCVDHYTTIKTDFLIEML